MKRILLAWSFVIVATVPGTAESNNFVTVAPQPSASAWWVDAQFHPFETQVRGVPVNKIRASWYKASEFRRDLFPPDLAKDLDLNQASFSIDGYFDGSKVPQTALIGVYETCRGDHGSFLMVLARPQGKPPTVRFLHAIPDLQFGVLTMRPDATVDVFHCMECDHVTSFKWDKSKKRFVRLKPAADE